MLNFSRSNSQYCFNEPIRAGHSLIIPILGQEADKLAPSINEMHNATCSLQCPSNRTSTSSKNEFAHKIIVKILAVRFAA